MDHASSRRVSPGNRPWRDRFGEPGGLSVSSRVPRVTLSAQASPADSVRKHILVEQTGQDPPRCCWPHPPTCCALRGSGLGAFRPSQGPSKDVQGPQGCGHLASTLARVPGAPTGTGAAGRDLMGKTSAEMEMTQANCRHGATPPVTSPLQATSQLWPSRGLMGTAARTAPLHPQPRGSEHRLAQGLSRGWWPLLSWGGQQ